MKRSCIFILALVVLLLFVTQAAQASIWCKYARFNPTFSAICFWEMMMDYWLIDDYFGGDTADSGGL